MDWFYSVAEPLAHFSSPPMAVNGDAEAAKLAMAITFFIRIGDFARPRRATSASGLARLSEFPQGLGGQIVLIVVMTSLATLSVYLGLDRGIRRLSQFTMIAGALLLIFVLAASPTVFLLDATVQNLGYYLQRVPELSTWTEAYRGSHWQNSWAIFYWAWRIAWSPFVGIC